MGKYVDGFVLPRNHVLKNVMAGPRMKDLRPEGMPFDRSRMIYGGFKPVVSM